MGTWWAGSNTEASRDAGGSQGLGVTSVVDANVLQDAGTVVAEQEVGAGTPAEPADIFAVSARILDRFLQQRMEAYVRGKDI